MADVFGKIKTSIDRSVATVSIKSSEFVEITKIKTQISVLESEMEALEKTLGKACYHQWCKNEQDMKAIEELCGEIKLKEDNIEACKAKILILQDENKKILQSEEHNTCAKCGAINKQEARFCIGCGEKLIADEMVFCSCGAKVKKQAKFCPACGSMMAQVQNQEAESQSEAADSEAESSNSKVTAEEVSAQNENPQGEEENTEFIICRCGQELPATAKFCGKCGESIG